MVPSPGARESAPPEILDRGRYVGLSVTWVLLFSVVFALVPAALCYLARWWLDRGELEPPWIFPVLMVLGGASGALFAVYGHAEVAALVSSLYGGEVPAEPLFVTTVITPAAEELGKAFVLLPFVLTHRWYRGPVDGLLYGFAAGAGFACAENFLYFANAYAAAGGPGFVAEVLGRAGPSAVIHGGATAAVGAFLGAARFDGRVSVVLVGPLSGFLLAMLIHGGWNLLVELGYLTTAWLMLPAVFLAFVVALGVALDGESAELRAALESEYDDGLLLSGEIEAATVLERRRGGSWMVPNLDRGRMLGKMMSLGYALRRFRREGRGRRHVNRLRADVARERKKASGMRSIEEPVEEG